MSSAGIIQDSVVRNRASSRITAERVIEDGKKVANRFAGLTINKIAVQETIAEALGESLLPEESSAPVLRQPKEARILKCWADSFLTNAESNLAALELTQHITVSGAEARKIMFEQLSAELKQIQAEIEEAQDALDKGIGDLDALKQQLEEARQKLSEVRQALRDLKEAGVKETDPRFIAAAAAVAAAEAGAEAAHQAVISAMTHVEVLAAKTQALVNKHTAKVEESARAVSNERGQVIVEATALKAVQQQNDTFLKRMILLLNKIIELLNEANAVKQQSDLELNKKRMEASRQHALEQTRENEKKMEKARKIQKIFGKSGKGVGITLAIVGIATALFDWGATAAAGVTITTATVAADEIPVDGKSLLEHGVGAVTDKLLKPLTDQLGKLVEEFMEEIGIISALIAKCGTQKAEEITSGVKTGVTVAVTAAVAVAAIVFAGPAAKAISKQASKLLETVIVKNIVELIKKLVPQFLKNAVKALSATAKEAFKFLDDLLTIQIKESTRDTLIKRVHVFQTAMTAVNTTVQSGSEIITAAIKLEAQRYKAKAKLAENDLDILTKNIGEIIEKTARNEKFTDDLKIKSSELIKNNHATSIFINQKIRTITA